MQASPWHELAPPPSCPAATRHARTEVRKQVEYVVAPHGWGNPAGRMGTLPSPVLPLKGAERGTEEAMSSRGRTVVKRAAVNPW